MENIPTFKFTENNFITRANSSYSLFDHFLISKWTEAQMNRAFRYIVSKGSIASKNEEILFHIERSDSSERATIIINCSSIEFGNSLMVPRLNDCLAQILTKDSLNHQHWHLYYLDFELELESIQCEKGILKDWPIPAF
ncbi:hypothetical protein B4U79_09469, partial [Dinothrombium tinctorium]